MIQQTGLKWKVLTQRFPNDLRNLFVIYYNGTSLISLNENKVYLLNRTMNILYLIYRAQKSSYKYNV